MKKVISLFLALLVCFSLSACGSASLNSSPRTTPSLQSPRESSSKSINTYTMPPAPTFVVPSVTFSVETYLSQQYGGYGLVWEETPQSTAFSYVGYDEDEEILAVIFRSNESRAYLYYDFSWDDWSDFISADSLGSYYNKYIKGYYDCERDDDAAALLKRGIIR